MFSRGCKWPPRSAGIGAVSRRRGLQTPTRADPDYRVPDGRAFPRVALGSPERLNAGVTDGLAFEISARRLISCRTDWKQANSQPPTSSSLTNRRRATRRSRSGLPSAAPSRSAATRRCASCTATGRPARSGAGFSAHGSPRTALTRWTRACARACKTVSTIYRPSKCGGRISVSGSACS